MNASQGAQHPAWPPPRGTSFTTCVTLLTVWYAFTWVADAAPPPHFGQVTLSGEGKVQLELQGTPGTNYLIEVSTDLKTWSLVGSGPTVNGVLKLQDALASGSASRFYRGKESVGSAVPPFPASVTLGVNTNLSVTTLITTNGGSALLYAPDGTQFTFTVPALTLPQPQLITMTLVTNVVGLPFTQGILGAVRLEPEGLALWGAGKLEITLAPGVDRRKIVSFTANTDGTEFHLTPDRVTANGVVIPVAQFRVFGSSLATTAEVAGVPVTRANLAAGGSGALTLHKGTGSKALAECFADRHQVAQSTSKKLDAVESVASQELSARIAAARQAQTADVSEDTFHIATLFEEASCKFLKEQVQPLVAAAQLNCELAKVLVVKSLGHERQRQLLGFGPDPDCPSGLDSFPFCAVMKNCLSEIEECCLLGRRGPAQVAAIIGLARQDQLLGSSCLSDTVIEDAIANCSSNAWTGTLTLSGGGATNMTVVNGNISKTTVETIEFTFTGEVSESEEFGSGKIWNSVTLRVAGNVTYRQFRSETVVALGECGGSYYLEQSELVGATIGYYYVSMILSPDNNYLINAFHFDASGPGTGSPGMESRLTYRKQGRKVFTGDRAQCVSEVKTTSDRFPNIVVAPPIALIQRQTSDINAISGSSEVKDPEFTPAYKGQFQWNFKRHRKE